MWHKLVRYRLDVWFRRPVVHENDNRGAYFMLNYRRVSRGQCFTPGDNEMESSSTPSLENVSLASLITRGYGFWTKWILFSFLSRAISKRKRQNNQKEVLTGPNLIIAVYSPDRNSERIHAHKSHLKHRAWFGSESKASVQQNICFRVKAMTCSS